eukprot:1645874-Prymnesium_polylepis.2
MRPRGPHQRRSGRRGRGSDRRPTGGSGQRQRDFRRCGGGGGRRAARKEDWLLPLQRRRVDEPRAQHAASPVQRVQPQLLRARPQQQRLQEGVHKRAERRQRDRGAAAAAEGAAAVGADAAVDAAGRRRRRVERVRVERRVQLPLVRILEVGDARVVQFAKGVERLHADEPRGRRGIGAGLAQHRHHHAEAAEQHDAPAVQLEARGLRHAGAVEHRCDELAEGGGLGQRS